MINVVKKIRKKSKSEIRWVEAEEELTQLYPDYRWEVFWESPYGHTCTRFIVKHDNQEKQVLFPEGSLSNFARIGKLQGGTTMSCVGHMPTSSPFS